MKRNRKGKTTLADHRPDVAAMWDFEHNGDDTPDNVSYGMDSKKFHWRCEVAEDHRWQASPNSMTNPNRKWGTGCPFCAGRELSVTNQLDLNHPEIAAQWFQERNGDVTPDRVLEGATQSFWWKCDKGSDHEWEQKVRVRTKQGTGCPFCAGHRPSVTNSLAALYPEVAELWADDLNDGLTPRDIVANANKRYTWRCPKGPDHIWEAAPNSVTRPKKWGTGCPFCAGRELSVTNRLDLNHPEVADQWFQERNGDVTPDRILEGSNSRFWWKCNRGPDHEWKATVSSRTNGRGCPCCAGQKVSVTNSLKARFPDIADEWDYERNGELTPDDVTAGSRTKRWWVCDKGPDHRWKAAPGTRTNPSVNFPGCPFCAGKKVSVTNSLKARFPDIADEWDYEHNGELTPDKVTYGANRPAHWICPDKGHRYKTNINWRTSDGTGCAECYVRPTSLVELAIKFELSAFFNVDLSPTSKVKGASGKNLPVDILLSDDRIIIEYDGYYYHKEISDRYESDSRKTDSLKRAGWTVIRMREKGLRLIGQNDVQVHRVDEGRMKTEQKKAAVNLMLRHLEGIMGSPIPGLDEYIAQPNLRRYDDARDSYDAIRRG